MSDDLTVSFGHLERKEDEEGWWGGIKGGAEKEATIFKQWHKF